MCNEEKHRVKPAGRSYVWRSDGIGQYKDFLDGTIERAPSEAPRETVDWDALASILAKKWDAKVQSLLDLDWKAWRTTPLLVNFKWYKFWMWYKFLNKKSEIEAIKNALKETHHSSKSITESKYSFAEIDHLVRLAF